MPIVWNEVIRKYLALERRIRIDERKRAPILAGSFIEASVVDTQS